MSANIAYYGGIVTDGLVLNLDSAKRASYPGFGATWTSVATGNVATASLVNGPTFNTEQVSSIQFDGIDDYAGLIFPFAKTNVISINVWINFLSITNTTNPPIFQVQNGGNTPDAAPAKVLGGWISQTSGEVWGRIIDTAGTKNLSATAGTVQVVVNQWNYCSYIADGTNYKLYVNSVYKKQIAYNGTISAYDRIFFAAQGPEESYSRISNVQIYNRALSAAEILQNYNAQRGRFGL